MPPDAGGWNAFLTAWVAADVMNPVSTAYLNSSCDKALFGWPCDAATRKAARRFRARGGPGQAEGDRRGRAGAQHRGDARDPGRRICRSRSRCARTSRASSSRRCRCSGTSKSPSELSGAGGDLSPPAPFQSRADHVHVRLSPAATARHHSCDADRCGLHLPHASSDAVGSGGDHRRRQRQRRTGGADPQPTRPRPADDAAVLHLVGPGADRRFRRKLLLQEDRRRADRRADRTDAVAGLLHDADRGVPGGAARRDGGALARQLARSRRDGFLGARIFGAGVRGRLSPDLRVLDLAELVAGAGLSAHFRRRRRLGRCGCCCPR